MIRGKNYKTVSTFVKIMPRILWRLFLRTRCRIIQSHPMTNILTTRENLTLVASWDVYLEQTT